MTEIECILRQILTWLTLMILFGYYKNENWILNVNHQVSNKILVFIYLGFYIVFNTVQVISRRGVEGQRKPVHTVCQGSVL